MMTEDELFELAADVLDGIDYDADDLVYYAEYVLTVIYATGYIYNAPAEGGAEFKADLESPFAFRLYACPEGMYCWPPSLSYNITPVN